MIAALELARAHAPIVVLTLLFTGAALAMLVSHGRASWALGVLAALAACTVAGEFGWRFVGAGGISSASPLISVDGVGAFAAPLLAGLTALTAIAEASWLRDKPGRARPYVIALHLAAGASWIGALFARDLIGLVVCANAAWLAAAALTALSPNRGALNGALRMVMSGGVGAALMLLGAGLISGAFGAGAVSGAANAIPNSSATATLGFVLLLAPLLLMAGAAPFHAWTGPAYGRSDAGLALILAASGALAIVARVAAVAATSPAVAESVSAALVCAGVASVLIGSLQAVGASNGRRLIAYASAAQAGCILVAIALESPAGLAAALVQLVALSAAAFALLGGVAASKDAALWALDGLGRRAPLSGIAITVGALSFMGAPLTLGFLGRWRLIEAGVGAGWWWATGAAVITSLAAVFYGGRLIERLYFRRATEASAVDIDGWRLARAPVLVAAVVAIACGLAPGWLLNFAARAAALALGLGA